MGHRGHRGQVVQARTTPGIIDERSPTTNQAVKPFTAEEKAWLDRGEPGLLMPLLPSLWGDRMRRFVEGADRGQSTLFPECLEDWIEEDNPETRSRSCSRRCVIEP
jgi:hypothetical protein